MSFSYKERRQYQISRDYGHHWTQCGALLITQELALPFPYMHMEIVFRALNAGLVLFADGNLYRYKKVKHENKETATQEQFSQVGGRRDR